MVAHNYRDFYSSTEFPCITFFIRQIKYLVPFVQNETISTNFGFNSEFYWIVFNTIRLKQSLKANMYLNFKYFASNAMVHCDNQNFNQIHFNAYNRLKHNHFNSC